MRVHEADEKNKRIGMVLVWCLYSAEKDKWLCFKEQNDKNVAMHFSLSDNAAAWRPFLLNQYLNK